MSARARRFAGSVSAFAVALAFSGVLRLVATAYIVRVLSPAAFGEFVTLGFATWVAQGIASFGLGAAALRFSPECETPAERRTLFSTMLAARLGAGVLIAAFIAAASTPIARAETGTAEHAGALALLAAFWPLEVIGECLSDELRARGRMGSAAGLFAIWAALANGLSAAFVSMGLGLMGLVYARGLSHALALAVGLLLAAPQFLARPSLPVLRRLLGFGWPFGVVTLLGTLRATDRPLLRALSSLGSVAAYEVSILVTGPMHLANLAFARVLEPAAYGHSGAPETPGAVDVFARNYTSVFASLALGLALAAPEIIGVYAPDSYREACPAVSGLAFLAVAEGLGRVAAIGADLAKQPRVRAIAAAVLLVTGVLFTIALVPRLGMAGAGVAWTLATSIATLLLYRVSRAVSGITLPVVRAVALVAGGAALGTAAAWQPWPIPARVALWAVYSVIGARLMGARWAAFVLRRAG